MRIAVVSDIHGNLAALQAAVGDFTRRGVDAVVNLGDSLSGPLLPAETAQFLMAQDWMQAVDTVRRMRATPSSSAKWGAGAQLIAVPYAHAVMATLA